MCALVSFLCVVVFTPDPSFSPTSLTLGEGGYETRQLTAPAATGPLLEAFAYALTGTRVGPVLRRVLLAANGFEGMRTLAEQVHDPPLYFPMRRLSAEDFAENERLAAESESLLNKPLQDLPSVEVSCRCHAMARLIDDVVTFRHLLVVMVRLDLERSRIMPSSMKRDFRYFTLFFFFCMSGGQ